MCELLRCESFTKERVMERRRKLQRKEGRESWSSTGILALERWRQKDQEFKVILCYTVNLRIAWSTVEGSDETGNRVQGNVCVCLCLHIFPWIVCEAGNRDRTVNSAPSQVRVWPQMGCECPSSLSLVCS